MSPLPITGPYSERVTSPNTAGMDNTQQETQPPLVETMDARKKCHQPKPSRKQRLRPQQRRTLLAFRLTRTALLIGIGSSRSIAWHSSSHCLPFAAVSAFVPSISTPSSVRHRQKQPSRRHMIMASSSSSSSSRKSTTTMRSPLLRLSFSSSSHNSNEEEDNNSDDDETIKRQVFVDSQQLRDSNNSNNSSAQKAQRLSRVKRLAKNMIQRPFSLATTVPMPSAIAAILQEASLAAVEQAMDVSTSISSSLAEERMQRSSNQTNNNNSKGGRRFRRGGGKRSNDDDEDNEDSNMDMTTIEEIIEEAFAPMEASLNDMEYSLELARSSLQQAKQQSYEAMQALQMAATAQAEAAVNTVAQVEKQLYIMENDDIDNIDISTLTLDDVDFASSEMAPPFLDAELCLVPGEPIVRVEKAPENSRRIFAGIDILASVEDVWQVLTNYAELQNVVPNLVVNDVLELYDGSSKRSSSSNVTYDPTAPEEVQCQQIAQQMKGSLLKQVGGAKVAGIRFSAKTTLEVREWPQGLPDFAHFTDDMWDGKSRDERAQEYPKIKLKRYRFPRPFAVSKLPTRDISMQSIPDDDGEFRLYQGVWRMQPLPGCAPPGKKAMRLTYAVEISPRAYLPVSLVERRIVQDLCTNLEAIRNAVTTKA